MRKLVSGLLVLGILLCCVPAFGFQDLSETECGETVTFLQAAGILDGFTGSDFEPEKSLTRAEAADIVVRASGYSEEKLIPFNEQVFWDVSSENPYFASVNAAYYLKIISGVGGNDFAPEEGATAGQAIKMLVGALGWTFDAELRGGFPTGYLAKANELKLLKGAGSLDVDAPITRGTMAQLVRNALEADCLIYDEYRDGEQVGRRGTLLKDCLEIYEGKGIVRANSFTSLYGESTLREDEIKIDDTVYSVEGIDTGKLIGSKVSFYYRRVDDEDIIFSVQTKNNEEILINAEELIAFSDMEYRYYNTKGTVTTKKISSNADIIYNGKSPQNPQEEMYLPKAGSVRLISNDNDAEVDVLLIENYINIVVNNVNANDSIIYDKINAENTINLNPSDKEVVYEIWNEQGEKTGLEALRSGMLLSVMRSDDGELVRIYINSGRADGKIETVNMEKRELVMNGETYKISPLYDMETQAALRAGDEGCFYLDLEGKIGYFEQKVSSSMTYGYLVNAAMEGVFADRVKVKMFTVEGQMQTFYLKKNAQIDGTTVKEAEQVIHRLSDASGVKAQTVRYSLSTDGEISVLDLAYLTAPEDGEDKDSFYVAYDSGATELEYKSYAGTFAGRVNIDDNTVAFLVPQEKNADDRAFSVVKKSYFINDKGYRAVSYKTKQDQIMADVLVVPKSSNEPVGDTATLALITEFVTGLNEDGEPQAMIQMLHDGVEKTLFLEDEKLAEGLERGDVIRYAQNNLDEINLIELSYDHSTDTIINGESHQNRLYNAKFRLMKRGIYNKDGKVMVVVPEESVRNPQPEELVNYTLVTMSKIYVYDTKTGKAYIGTENDLIDYKHGGEDYSRIFFRSEYAQPRDIIIYR